MWVVTRHQYGISALVSQTSFCRETSGSVAKYRLFSQATTHMVSKLCIYFPFSVNIRCHKYAFTKETLGVIIKLSKALKLEI